MSHISVSPMSTTGPSDTDTGHYTAHDLVEDLGGLYASGKRLYSSQINENEFNTLDAMNKLREQYPEDGEYSQIPAEIAGEKDWNHLENLLNGAVEQGLLEREIKHVDLPNESYPRKNLFYRIPENLT